MNSRMPDIITKITNPSTGELNTAKIFYTKLNDDPVRCTFDSKTNEFEIMGGKNIINSALNDLAKTSLNENETLIFDPKINAEGLRKGLEERTKKRVNHPDHYTNGDIECIDAIRASMTDSEFSGYCKGNCLKYIWRYDKKNGIEDLKKAEVYLNWLINTLKGEELTKV